MKLKNKLFVLNAAIILTVFLLIGVVAIAGVYDQNLKNVHNLLLHQSIFSQRYLSQYFAARAKEDPHNLLAENRSFLEAQLMSQVGFPVVVTGLTGGALRPEQEAALRGSKAYFIDTWSVQGVFYFSFPIRYGEEVLGTVSYQYSLFELDRMRRDLVYIFLGLFTFALLLAFVLSYLLSARIIKPLEVLQHNAGELGKGRFDVMEPIKTGDEIDSLAESFSRMGQDIKGMIRSLEEEQAKQKRFYDSVTHEIRTPLTNIIGYADLFFRLEQEEEKEKSVALVHQEGEALLRMVENLLELSKLKQYEINLDKKEENLKTLMEETLEAMAPRLKMYGFTVKTNLANLFAEVDAGKLRQVLLNLMDNAIKYSDGDTLELRLWREEKVCLQVKDNGRGISPEDLDKILEPFYRVEKSRSRKLGGAGLGLSICREIIAKHGGGLAIESEVGQGTTVTICLQP
jgi:two-component system, OmpR family, sensor histidine kinase ArlS